MALSRVVSCDHVGLFTNDAARLVRFYCSSLGFSVEKEEILPASIMKAIFGLADSCRLVKLAGGGAAGKDPSPPLKVEIFQPLRVKLSRRRNGIVGFNHGSFSVDDRMRFVQGLRSGDVPLIEVRRNGHSVFFIKDPDGNRIEIRD
jgi:catechol 2,3-dioxygenase-like lactoylglutathione lyase family enzyme